MFEWIGILGSVTIIVAFMFHDELKIRIFDAIGALLFIVYGILIGSFSTVFLNAVLITVHIFKIVLKHKASSKE